jgi:chromosome segregation ATPase
MAAEHKAACEKVERDLQQLQEAYQGLDKELDEKHEEIESYQRRLAGTDGSDASEIQNLRREIKHLEEDIKQSEIDKRDMEEQIQTLQRDASHLLEKDGKMARERSDERKTLHNVYPIANDAYVRISRSCKSN